MHSTRIYPQHSGKIDYHMDTDLSSENPEPESLTRARKIIASAAKAGIEARLLGGLAIWERCPSARTGPFNRVKRSGDIDLVVSSRHRQKFERMLCHDFGLLIDGSLASIPNEIHARFYSDTGIRICDVTYDRLDFCHSIDLRKRLTVDNLEMTIPLAELLLTKLQIVEPSLKDILDTIAIAVDHSFGQSDGEIINLPIICHRCASDWALEYTVRKSAYRVCRAILDMDEMAWTVRVCTLCRFFDLLDALHIDIKPIRWRIRAARGRGKKWYSEPISYPDPYPDELRMAL